MRCFLICAFCIFFNANFAQDNNYILNDDFDNNNNNWQIDADQTRIFKIEGGVYSIQNKLQYNSVSSRINREFDQNRDFLIECEITKTKGFNKKGFGLVWGREKTDYYGFYITGAGEFLVLKWEAGKREFIVGIQKSPQVKVEDSKNKLSIKKESNKQYFYINDSLVQVTDFFPFYGQEIGFANGGKLTMEVDYLRVKYLKEEVLVKPTRGNVVLDESFENNANEWPEGKIKGGNTDISNGKYFSVNKSNNPLYTYVNLEIDTDKDFVISSSIEEIVADKDDSYCIMWGADLKTNQYYAFRLNTFYGSYEYYRIREKEVDKLIDITFHSSILKNPGEKNKVVIKKIGKEYSFFINDVKVNDFRYQPVFGNDIGFINHFKHKIIIDDLIIQYITPSF
jgi:hypothetical protein